MILDPRHYARYDLTDGALETWRRHACLPRISPAQREATYAAATPLLCAAATALVQQHAWRPAAAQHPAELFSIQHPTTDVSFVLPRTLTALFAHAAACARMFDAVFPVHLDVRDSRPRVAEPLADVFHLLQLLAPGCFALIKAEYATHEVDDDGEVAWITWHTYARGLPPPAWMDLHAQESPQLVAVFGETRWASLRRAAADFEVLAGGDVTFG